MPLRASEFRGQLYFQLLSRSERRRDLEEELEAIYAYRERELGFALRPEGPFCTKNRDILLCLHNGHILGALSIEIAPRLEGLVIDPDSPWPQIQFNELTSHAEGMLLAQGFDWYDVGIPENYDQGYIEKIAGAKSTIEQLAGKAIRIFRRFLN